MDLNELLHHHQVATMKASMASSDTDRKGHFDKVSLYAKRIRVLREDAKLPPYVWPAPVNSAKIGR